MSKQLAGSGLVFRALSMTLLLLPAVAVMPGVTESAGLRSGEAEVTAGDGPGDKLHDPWDRLLRSHVTEDGWVAYGRLQAESGGELLAYLDSLADIDASALPRDEQIAFWINAYNALCIQTLIDQKLPSSVPHQSFLGVGTNIFTLERRKIAGRVRSLDDIEHRVLRKRFDEPRVHAALVCGASSCPRLRPEAFIGSRLDRQLDEEMRRWIQSGLDLSGKRKNRLDRERQVFYASRIFDWFKKDFGGTDKAVLEFVKKYVDAEDREFLDKNKVSIRFLDYSWRINRQPADVAAKE